MVGFSPEQGSAISTQYGLLGASQTSLLEVSLTCLQDFPGDALVYPTADSSLIDKERVACRFCIANCISESVQAKH